ncbi:MAG TPA: hypothetical protein VH249_06865 [Xanthobacteraceae bacterium]|jgi:hypothetical protein|nr:hypothetical protein [Xanthobacteraceae bacterium]
MPAILRLYEDTLSGDGAFDAALPAMPRMIFVVHGAATVATRTLGDGEAWFGAGSLAVTPGNAGVTCWRFELAPPSAADGAARGRGVVSYAKLSVRLDGLPAGDLLLRGDSVAFPPGGCAYLHTHQGPGIRCLVEGGIRIDTHGASTSYGPGGAWFESGPEPVFAQGADRPTRFVRVMILPRTLLGKSSISYVNEEDKTRPKSQQYKIFVDEPVARE